MNHINNGKTHKLNKKLDSGEIREVVAIKVHLKFSFKRSSCLSLSYFLRQGVPEPLGSYFKSSVPFCLKPRGWNG